MKRIRAFGCSLTQQHHWKYLRIKEIDLKSYAIGSQGNDVQFAQYMNAVHDGDILKDDVIIWQLTNPYRRMVNMPNTDKLPIHEGANVDNSGWASTVAGKGYWLDMKNIFCSDNPYYHQRRIQGVVRNHHSLNPGESPDKPGALSKAEYNWYQENDTGLPVYEMLLQLNGVKRDNDKLLVIFGWKEMMGWDKNNSNENVIKYLKKQGIDYIEEPINDWVQDQGYKLDDFHHPNQKGYQAYTNNVLSQKLRQLKWLD